MRLPRRLPFILMELLLSWIAAYAQPRDLRSQTNKVSVTWSHHIAPLLYDHCATCHHPGGAGPFSLLTYADARRWGRQIETVTQSRYMPPWLPEPDHGDFAEVRRLPDEDLALIKKWVAAGMPQGDAKAAPAAPKYDANWQLGKPDLVLKAAEPFTLAAGGTDVFRNFILPYPLKEEHFIRAMEIRPGAAQVVHHANVLIDRTGSFRRQHPADWQKGVPGMDILLDAGNSFDPDSHFLFWKPDTPALIEPEGMPWRVDPGNDLVVNTHLKPSGKAEPIEVEVGLYFTDKPPEKKPMLLQLDRDDALDIPAGDNAFTVEDELTLPVDVELLGIYPHAHYLGKEMQGWATLPGGEKKWLVWIRDWDIDRQSVYRYREPVLLPKGTVLHMHYVYDNSTANPRNPHNPPMRVRAGNRSEDEMAHMWLQVLPVHEAAGAPDPRLELEEAWMRARLRKTPGDRVSEYNLGAALAGEGRFREASDLYSAILRRFPGDALTLTAQGVALDGAGDPEGARKALQQVIDGKGEMNADPAQVCNARFDLASLDLRHDQPDRAVAEFRAQLAACPEDAETHAQLARAYAQSGEADRMDKALSELRAAEKLNPDDALVHSALSQVLAGAGKIEDAVEEQRLALKLAPGDADADGWNNLGALEARMGRTKAAREDFEQALRIDPAHAQARANLARLPASP